MIDPTEASGPKGPSGSYNENLLNEANNDFQKYEDLLKMGHEKINNFMEYLEELKKAMIRVWKDLEVMKAQSNLSKEDKKSFEKLQHALMDFEYKFSGIKSNIGDLKEIQKEFSKSFFKSK